MLSERQFRIMFIACLKQKQPEPFLPCYPVVKCKGKELASARRLAERGMLVMVDEYPDEAFFMGTDKGAQAVGEYLARRAR